MSVPVHYTLEPFGPILQSWICVQFCLQSCLLLLLTEPSGWGCGCSLFQLLLLPCCAQVLQDWLLVGESIDWAGIPQLLPHSSLGSRPCCSMIIQDRTIFFFFPKLLCDLYIILRKGWKAECKYFKDAQYSRERQSTHCLETWSLQMVILHLTKEKQMKERIRIILSTAERPLSCNMSASNSRKCSLFLVNV